MFGLKPQYMGKGHKIGENLAIMKGIEIKR
jgi:hypothetical protein